MHDGRHVGRVAELWRYPVKAMAGEALAEAEVSWNGLAGDRRWAFVRPGMLDSTFPWMTMRQRSELCRYVPSFVDPGEPNASPTRVRTPAGAELDVTDPALARELGDGVTLLRQGRGSFDAAPLSLLSRASAAALDADPRRLRPNVVVELDDAEAFAEEGWVGEVVRLGDARMRVDRRDPRCVVIDVDPDTGERAPGLLREVAQRRDGCLGVYGQVVAPGRVAVGDPVVVECAA